MAIPWTTWFTHYRRLTCPAWRSNHYSPKRDEEGLRTDPSRKLRHIKVPVQCKTVCLLAQHQQRHWATHQNMPHLSETLSNSSKHAPLVRNIEQLIKTCPTCQKHWPQEQRQPLKQTPLPEWPWQQLGADFMIFDGCEYLVTIDYSKMPIVWKTSTSECNNAKTIIVLPIMDNRSDLVRQWTPVCKSPLCWVCKGLEHYT